MLASVGLMGSINHIKRHHPEEEKEERSGAIGRSKAKALKR
jgi:hypothetical protein